MALASSPMTTQWSEPGMSSGRDNFFAFTVYEKYVIFIMFNNISLSRKMEEQKIVLFFLEKWIQAEIIF
jgi:hypothetical protein